VRARPVVEARNVGDGIYVLIYEPPAGKCDRNARERGSILTGGVA